MTVLSMVLSWASTLTVLRYCPQQWPIRPIMSVDHTATGTVLNVAGRQWPSVARHGKVTATVPLA
jgi:hypothetical protein